MSRTDRRTLPRSRATTLTQRAAGTVLACGIALAPAAQAQVQAQAQTQEPPTGAVALPTVDVSASPAPGALPQPYAGGQVARGGTLGLLGARSVMDTPFSTTSYTAAFSEDQQARTIADTLVNDSSVRLTTGAGGFDDTFQIRGFAVPAQDVGMNGLYGLVSSNRVPSQIIERIELLRGPGALINGISPGGSIGGGINIVTKRAEDTPLTRLTTSYMGSGNLGVATDIARRYGANGEWGIRFNGLHRDGEATIDGGNLQSYVAALGLDYRGERLRWSVDGIFQRDNTKNFRPQISLLSTTAVIPAAPDARSNWYPGTNLRQQDSTIATRLEYDLTENLTVYGAIGYRDGWNEQVFPVSAQAVDALGNFRVGNSFYDSYSKTVSGTVGANWRFSTFGVGHTLNAGYTGFQQEAGNAYIAQPGNIASNIYRPVALPLITLPRTDPRRASETSLTSFALADTLSFLGDRLLLTGGLRYQQVQVDSYSTATGARTSRYDADATTPMFGIVVKPLQNVSLYANYAEGLTRGQIVGVGYSNFGEVLAPYKSQQYEAGVRVDWGRVTTSASVFQIARPNAIRTAANDLAYDGEQRNRGLELSAYGEILPGLRGLASATFIKPELTSTANAAERGNDAQGVPDRTFSGALDWDVPGVTGLAVNGRVIYTSGAYINTANTARFDAWTRVDIGARYRTEIQGKPVTFRANLENLFGEDYWLTTGTYVTVGSPRTVIVSASFDF
ncbi:TonB-dependent siderophore receptor [Roseomonas sp. 18066]|uniref:TonB-dependent receptor n=1 Tax=Roseomonas sp. 18066 TaxID=2681412 RepID=UPI001357D101|nr:TonB-dependent siderophore receptor [Roseomonas sp. 18066]